TEGLLRPDEAADRNGLLCAATDQYRRPSGWTLLAGCRGKHREPIRAPGGSGTGRGLSRSWRAGGRQAYPVSGLLFSDLEGAGTRRTEWHSELCAVWPHGERFRPNRLAFELWLLRDHVVHSQSGWRGLSEGPWHRYRACRAGDHAVRSRPELDARR